MTSRLYSIRLAAPLFVVGLLSACNEEPAAPAADKGSQTAEGDVLKGSISDEMLPLDALTSQSPAAKIEAGPDKAANAPTEDKDTVDNNSPGAEKPEAGDDAADQSTQAPAE